MTYISVLKKNWVLKQYDNKLVEKYCEKYLLDEIYFLLFLFRALLFFEPIFRLPLCFLGYPIFFLHYYFFN